MKAIIPLKASKKITVIGFFTLSLALIATQKSQAQVLADVRGNYVANATSAITDTLGTGVWNYNSSAYGNLSSQAALTWVSTPGAEAGPYYGGTDLYGLPGLNDSQIFSDGALASSNQVALHPGRNSNVDLQWVAGAGETGLLTLSGVLSRIGEVASAPGTGEVDFTIFVNGVSAFSALNIPGGTTSASEAAYSFTFSSTVGTTVDFVISHAAGQDLFGDESLLSATIAVPEPSTWALLACSAGFLLFARRGNNSPAKNLRTSE